MRGDDAMSGGKEYFKECPTGTVVAMEPEEYTGAIYHVWFPYARSYMNEVKEGGLVAVRNFNSKESERSYSILEMVNALPVHYALGTSPADTEKAFPGFVVEAAKSAKVDWEQEEPIEHTTKIRAEAIPTGLQLIFPGHDGPSVEMETSIPMIGEEAYLLSNEMIAQVINRGLTHAGANVITPCKLVLNSDIDIHIKVDDLLRTHFGVFGFTGAGKSNLLSNLIYHLENHKGPEPLKIVLFDLMTEYSALLLDVVHQNEESFILSLETNAVVGGDDTLQYMKTQKNLDRSLDTISRTILLPKELESVRESYRDCLRAVIEAKKLKILDSTSEPPLASELHAILSGKVVAGMVGEVKPVISDWLDDKFGGDRRIDFNQIERTIGELDGYIRAGKMDYIEGGGQSTLDGGGARKRQVELKARGGETLRNFRTELQELLDLARNPPPESAAMTFNELVGILNSKTKSSLIIIQSDKDSHLRSFASNLINKVFAIRRHKGQINPSILFVFDEADEFIPQSVSKEDESYALSKAAVTTLARRGRKFGMGMAIATQRIAYLDTSIMAQPHTYFISKLPREYDRQAMSQAFGITEDMMRKTLKFSKGQWLLVSFDATGIENIPIPVQFSNANTRVKKHLATRHE